MTSKTGEIEGEEERPLTKEAAEHGASSPACRFASTGAA